MVIFTSTRFLLLQLNKEKVTSESGPFVNESFAWGFKFDLLITSYLLLIPFLLLTVYYLLNQKPKALATLAKLFLQIIIIPVFLICCADIAYFSFFNSRLTSSVHMWMQNFGEMMKFLFSDKTYYPHIAIFFIGGFFLVWLIGKFSKPLFIVSASASSLKKILVVFVSASLMFYGVRGGNILRPLGMREAFFTNFAFINQLTLNPAWTYFDSFSVFKINYLQDSEAIIEAKKFYAIPSSSYSSALARAVKGEEAIPDRNVVIILMESMSAERMGIFGNTKNLTPYLDSLAKCAHFYNHFYSCGVHTCNGIYGTLYGFPSLLAVHPMSNVQSTQLYFTGLPVTLKSFGYTNLFFCTHHEQFDNLGYFLSRNGIDRLYSSKDYPSSERVNNWGISDEFLFEFAMHELDSLDQLKKKFFSTILTISTHPPQEMPPNTKYKPRSGEVYDQVFEYADWCLKNFMESVKEKPWYKNTIFVFLGDHGVNAPSNFEAPLSFNHIPLIIFDPQDSTAFTDDRMGIQTDIYPTIMEKLKAPYINNTAGQSLLSHERPFAFFSQDTKLCIINHDNYLVINRGGSESFYDLHKSATAANSEVENAMKRYAYSILQTTQSMLDHGQTGQPK